MKLRDARGAYELFSGKASDIMRQISLAGVGLIWVFRSTTDTTLSLDPTLLRAALFIFLALSLDFLQYLLGTIIWIIYYRRKEKTRITEEEEFLAPSQLNWPTWGLFYLKSSMMLIAYGCYIIPFLISRLRG